MATLKDVSRASGYSVTTVSRALNGFTDVTEATRRHIEAVARRLDYRPNQAARKLVSGRSGMVGLVPGAPPLPFEYGHFFHIIAGASRAFAARERDLVLHVGNGREDELATYARMIGRGTLDGFVVTAPDCGDARVALLLERDVPFVLHGRDPEQSGYAYVDGDNHAIGAEGAALLAEAGHRRIGLINGPEGRAYSDARARLGRPRSRRAGLSADPRAILSGDTSPDYGRRAAAALLSLDPAPTAIACCNSLTALGALEALRAAGLRVPQDVSLAAHDDVLPQVDVDRLNPPLSGTRLALEDAAEPLADLLLRRIAGEPAEALAVIQRASPLEGRSVAPPLRS